VNELDLLINEDAVADYCYNDALMVSTDSKRDWTR